MYQLFVLCEKIPYYAMLCGCVCEVVARVSEVGLAVRSDTLMRHYCALPSHHPHPPTHRFTQSRLCHCTELIYADCVASFHFYSAVFCAISCLTFASYILSYVFYVFSLTELYVCFSVCLINLHEEKSWILSFRVGKNGSRNVTPYN